MRRKQNIDLSHGLIESLFYKYNQHCVSKENKSIITADKIHIVHACISNVQYLASMSCSCTIRKTMYLLCTFNRRYSEQKPRKTQYTGLPIVPHSNIIIPQTHMHMRQIAKK